MMRLVRRSAILEFRNKNFFEQIKSFRRLERERDDSFVGREYILILLST